MARAKTDAFDADLVRTAKLAKALAHPVRIRILEILGGQRGCICGGLVELLPLAQSTVSQHLRELREAGLIQGDVDGARTCYCLDLEALDEARTALGNVFVRCCEPEGRRLARATNPPTTSTRRTHEKKQARKK